MKCFYLFLIFSFLLLPCEAFSLFGNSNGIYRNDIANAEKIVFGKSNSFYSQENRLERLEKELFGTIQSGSVKDRISLINRVLAGNEYTKYRQSYSSPARINRIRNKIFSSRNYNQNEYRRNKLRNGRMTGFEPPVHHTPLPRFSNRNINRNRYQYSPHYNPYYNHNRINTNIP